MSEFPPHQTLAALRYESADPATLDEIDRNHGVIRLNHLLAQQPGEPDECTIVQLRAGACR